jgi:hypothetical protein
MDQLKDNIRMQLNEIEILKSIYSRTNEFQAEDEDALMEAEEFLGSKNIVLKRNISFLIRFNLQNELEETQVCQTEPLDH